MQQTFIFSLGIIKKEANQNLRYAWSLVLKLIFKNVFLVINLLFIFCVIKCAIRIDLI